MFYLCNVCLACCLLVIFEQTCISLAVTVAGCFLFNSWDLEIDWLFFQSLSFYDIRLRVSLEVKDCFEIQNIWWQYLMKIFVENICWKYLLKIFVENIWWQNLDPNYLRPSRESSFFFNSTFLSNSCEAHTTFYNSKFSMFN